MLAVGGDEVAPVCVDRVLPPPAANSVEATAAHADDVVQSGSADPIRVRAPVASQHGLIVSAERIDDPHTNALVIHVQAVGRVPSIR